MGEIAERCRHQPADADQADRPHGGQVDGAARRRSRGQPPRARVRHRRAGSDLLGELQRAIDQHHAALRRVARRAQRASARAPADDADRRRRNGPAALTARPAAAESEPRVAPVPVGGALEGAADADRRRPRRGACRRTARATGRPLRRERGRQRQRRVARHVERRGVADQRRELGRAPGRASPCARPSARRTAAPGSASRRPAASAACTRPVKIAPAQQDALVVDCPTARAPRRCRPARPGPYAVALRRERRLVRHRGLDRAVRAPVGEHRRRRRESAAARSRRRASAPSRSASSTARRTSGSTSSSA